MNLLAAGLALVACGPARDGADRVDPTDSADVLEIGAPETDTSAPEDTGAPDTGDTSAPDPCPLPPAPTTWTYLPDVPSSEDFAFDALGNLVNVDDGVDALVRTPYGGPTEIVAPYSSPEVAGVAFLLDGRLALADEGNGALVILGMDGSEEVLVGSLNQPNAITVDATGRILVTAYDRILRVDPSTGEGTEIWHLPGHDLDGLTLSADGLQLYFNYDEDSVVGAIALDAAGAPVAASVVVNLPEQPGAELDGMTADACGNLYAVSTGGAIFRVRTDGTAEHLITLGGVAGMLTSSLHFGSGIGGWAKDHLYVMNRYGGLFEVELGIDGRDEPHLP